MEELLAERHVQVDHVTVYRWVHRFTRLFADAARFNGHSPGDRWFVDETYVKVNGVWRYVYRAVDQHRQIIDVLVSPRRDGDAARRFFRRALTALKVMPTEVVTDAAYPASWVKRCRRLGGEFIGVPGREMSRPRRDRAWRFRRGSIAGEGAVAQARQTLVSPCRRFATSAGVRGSG